MDWLQTIPWLSVHVTAVAFTLGTVIIADLHGLMWLLGKWTTLPERRMILLHRATWVGLITIMFAGGMMFISYPEYLLSLTAFKFKMLFVAALVINAFLIGRHLHVATTTAFKDVPLVEKRKLIVSGMVSSISWIGAFLMAQLLS